MNAKPDTDRLPRWLRIVLVTAGAGAMWLSMRLVWEQTVLSWRNGPQMVGFSLMHAELGLFLVLLLATLSFCISLVVALLMTIVAAFRGRRISAIRLLGIVSGFAIVALGVVPYATWQRVFAANIATGAHAAEFFTYAAATGDLATVQTLHERGIDVNARNRDGSTALHAAAVEGQLPVLRYLVLQGADSTIRNNFGHTALDNAHEMKRETAIRYLAKANRR